MKKIAIILILVSATSTAWAQQGNWYIGGVAGFASNSVKDPAPSTNTTTTSSWAFGPEVGTFLKDDIQLGVFLGLSGSSIKDDGGDLSSGSFVTPTIYGRKFWSVTDNFSLFTGLYLSYISSTATNYGGTTTETKSTGFGARVGIGVAYALSPRFTAVGQYGLLGFSTLSDKINGNDAGSTTSVDFGVNTIGYSGLSQGNGSGSVFNIGIYYTLKQAN